MNRAVQEIDSLCGGGSQIEMGKLYHGRVTGTKDFGAFVECMPGKEGLVHISELADFRVRRTEDVVKMGEMIWVKCIGIDEKTGKVRLSRKAAMKEMETQAPQAAVEAPRFQTEHFYSSFAGHEFVPGRLNLEGRMPKSTIDALASLGHRVTIAGDWSNSSAPTVIWVHDGVLNGGADPRRARFIFGR